MEEIVVIGSRIARPDASAMSAIATFDRDEITRFDENTISNFINSLPQVTPDLGPTANFAGSGISTINLRGLGSARTLALINGRRMAPNGTGTSIDLNVVPVSLLERIEIVTGGASAVYGSDAVTGAINFVTRDDFEGLNIAANTTIPEQPGGEIFNFSISGGRSFDGERGHISGYIDHTERRLVRNAEREFSDRNLVDDPRSGTLIESGSVPGDGVIFFPPAFIDGQFASLIFNPDGSARAYSEADNINVAEYLSLQAPIDTTSAGLFIEWDATDTLSIFADLMYSRPKTEQRLAPVPAPVQGLFTIDGEFFNDSIRDLIRSTYDLDGDGLGQAIVVRRFIELGPETFTQTRESHYATIGIESQLFTEWTFEAYYAHALNRNEATISNNVSTLNLQQGLLIDPSTNTCLNPANNCVPTNVFGAGNLTPEAQAFVRNSPVESAERSDQQTVAAILTGELFSLAAGPLEAALGFEYRRNKARSEPDPNIVPGQVASNGFIREAKTSGRIRVNELFFELLAPLVSQKKYAHRLELELGGRVSNYSTSGTVRTWKIGGQWMPTNQLRFRSMLQRAIRAPNISELFLPSSVNLTGISGAIDFCSAFNDPGSSGLSDVCVAQGTDPSALTSYNPAPFLFFPVNFIFSGNETLQSEKARTLTAGVEYTVDGAISLTATADFYSVEIKDAISNIDGALDNCPIIRDVASPYCTAISRAPNGFITEIRVQTENIAAETTSGVDLSIDLSMNPPWETSVGAIGLKSTLSLLLERSRSLSPELGEVDCAGYFANRCRSSVGLEVGFGTTAPKLQSSTTFYYENQIWSAGLRWRWIAGTDNLEAKFQDPADPSAGLIAVRKIRPYNYFDLSIARRFGQALTLRFGINNVLDETPPLLGDQSSGANTDPARYDVLGRRAFISVEARID